jgi:hypothetical protein
MKKLATILAACSTILLSTQVQARHHHQHQRHHYSHHFGKHLAQYWHRRYHRHVARHYRHRDATRQSFALVKARLPDGQTITVNAPYADRFVGFFRELFDREWKLPEVHCYAAHGHMPLPWGRHPAGEACDVGQRARNVAWRVMYHITAIAHLWGLTDGCEWRGNPDCGHVQVNRAVATVPAVALRAIAAAVRTPSRRTYQVAGAWPL